MAFKVAFPQSPTRSPKKFFQTYQALRYTNNKGFFESVEDLYHNSYTRRK